MSNTWPVKSFLWLVVSVLFSGCITSNTLYTIKYNTTKELPDRIDRIERASLTRSNQLLICFEGRLTNSPRIGQYTLVVPLSDLKAIPYRNTATQTNTPFSWSQIKVKRNEIVDGWPAKELSGDAATPVPVGPPFLDGWFTNHLEKAGTLKPVPETDRTIFQVLFEGTNTMPYPSHAVLIYVDARRPETFTDIKIESVTVVEQHKGLIAVVPFAVAADIATLPFQFLFVCFYLSGPHC